METDSDVKSFPGLEKSQAEPDSTDEPKQSEERAGVILLRSWLNKSFKVEMTDGRILIGVFLCTDRDANIILGSCSEYLLSESKSTSEEPRMLGLVMIPGKHIVSLQLDTADCSAGRRNPVLNDVGSEEVT